MMMKHVVRDVGREKLNNRVIFQELLDKNEVLEEACFILDELQDLIRTVPDKLRTGAEQDINLTNSVLMLDDSLDKFLEATGVFFDEIEMKLDDIKNNLLSDDCGKMHRFTKTVSDVLCAQKQIDALISNAEEEIYKVLEANHLWK